MSHLLIRGWRKVAAATVLLAAAVAITSGSIASNGAETYDLTIANGRVMDPESGLDAIRKHRYSRRENRGDFEQCS